MFRTGDFVSKVGNGICKIIQTAEMSFGESEKQAYFELEPISLKGSRIFIPVANSEKRMRAVMNGKEALDLIARIPSLEPLMIENEKHREKQYQNALRSNEPEQVAQIIKTMYLRREKRFAQGKKNTALEENYFKIAEDRLYSELALALGESQDRVMSRIELAAKKSQFS